MFRATIPVYFHVVRAGLIYEEGYLPRSMITEQVKVLNSAFAGGYGGAATPFSFDLQSIDYTTNAEWFAMSYGSPAERAAKTALHQGGSGALNIYNGDGGSESRLAGISRGPGLLRSSPGA